MPQQPILEVLGPQRLFQQRVIMKVNHPRAQIVAGPPICVHLAELFRGQDRCHSIILDP
jgi:hypothetical protein